MDKPRLDQGPDYERGFIDGMMYQTQTTVNKAINAMSQPKLAHLSPTASPENACYTPPQRTWVGLMDEDCDEVERWVEFKEEGSGRIPMQKLIRYIEAKLKEKNERTL